MIQMNSQSEKMALDGILISDNYINHSSSVNDGPKKKIAEFMNSQ